MDTAITSPLFILSSSRCGHGICFNFFSAWVKPVFFVIQMSFEDNGSWGFADDSELNLSWVHWQRQAQCYLEMKSEEWRWPPGFWARAIRYGYKKWLICSSALRIQWADPISLEANGKSPTDFERSKTKMCGSFLPGKACDMRERHQSSLAQNFSQMEPKIIWEKGSRWKGKRRWFWLAF